jgi:hypothetical protein
MRGLMSCLRTAAFAVTVTFSVGRFAYANVVFRNTTDQPVVFTFHCPGGTYDRWTIAPRESFHLSCSSGGEEAQIRIVTREPNGDHTNVSGTVLDGSIYKFFVDADGDISYQSAEEAEPPPPPDSHPTPPTPSASPKPTPTLDDALQTLRAARVAFNTPVLATVSKPLVIEAKSPFRI